MTRMDRSARANIHGRWMRWPGEANIKVTKDSGAAFGVYLYTVVTERSTENWEDAALTELGFPSSSRDDTVSTTSEESEEGIAEDPTASLPPVVVTNKWGEPPPIGSGWWGSGAPIQVHHNYRTRDIVDGGGLCSPGRWHPSKRLLPELGDVGSELIKAMGINLPAFEKEAYKMFTGNLLKSPFNQDEVDKGKAFMVRWCSDWGGRPARRAKDRDQVIDIRLLQAFLQVAGDPEAPALDCYATGIRLGHNMRMPRTPAVFKAKKKWRLGYEPPEHDAKEWVNNYQTAKDNMAAVKTKITDDLRLRRMILTTYAAAKARYGDRLHVGAIGMVDEGNDCFRLIHDGTYGILVNNRIRPRDLVSTPLIHDIAAEMAEIQDTKRTHISFVWDFATAHRLIAMDEDDWGLQACSLVEGSKPQLADTDEVLLNTVGTFGMASAGYLVGPSRRGDRKSSPLRRGAFAESVDAALRGRRQAHHAVEYVQATSPDPPRPLRCRGHPS